LLRAARRRALAELPVVADGADPPLQPPDPPTLDTIVSAWKVEGRRPPPEAAAAAVDAFATLMAIRGQIDFDDLVVGALAALEADPQLRSRWQARFSHLCCRRVPECRRGAAAPSAPLGGTRGRPLRRW
jgi:hypothetical protein